MIGGGGWWLVVDGGIGNSNVKPTKVNLGCGCVLAVTVDIPSADVIEVTQSNFFI